MMRSKSLLAYLLALHALFLVFSWRLLGAVPWAFALVEALLVASLLGGWYLVKRALEPQNYTRRFQDLLQDREFAARLAPGKGPEINALVDSFNQMLTTLHEEHMRLGEQRGLLHRLLEVTPSAIVVFDFDGNVSLRNAAAEILFGAGTDAKETDAGRDLWNQLTTLLQGESRLVSTNEGKRYRGQRGHFFDRGFERQFLLVDELTQELANSERETYAKLIRVLAHEVNNTVGATGSVLDSLVFYSNQIAEDDRKDFTTAVGAVKQRNANLGTFIDRFAQVVKMPEPEFHPESVNALLERIALLYQERCRSQGIHLRWEHNEDSKPVLLDRYLMEQALMNILKNAIEAFDGASGEIALSIRSVNDFLQVSVSDSANGLQGIAPEKLFSPFFTTKRSGQGLGLLLVREVLQRHRFTYQLAPTGLGTTRFDIWMPLGKALQPTSHQAYQR